MSYCKHCDTKHDDGDVFCSKCGSKIEKEPKHYKVPLTMTVAEAAKVFFQGRVSEGLIYKAIREHRLPHVKMSSGKILLDLNELNAWWSGEIQKSQVISVKKGLRKID